MLVKQRATEVCLIKFLSRIFIVKILEKSLAENTENMIHSPFIDTLNNYFVVFQEISAGLKPKNYYS